MYLFMIYLHNYVIIIIREVKKIVLLRMKTGNKYGGKKSITISF